MTTESFLQYIFSHNAVLIETFVTAILLTAAFLTYRSFKMSKEEEQGSSSLGDTSQLESMLKKVLEKGVQQAEGSLAPAEDSPVSGEVAKLSEQNAHLKNELNRRLLEMEQLKNSKSSGASAPQAGVPPEVKVALENQVKELQKKLDEFDIISQDIADLSFYKEENQRLIHELEARGGEPPVVRAPPVAAKAAARPVAEEAAKPKVAAPDVAAAPAPAEPKVSAPEPVAEAAPEPVIETPAPAATSETAVQEVGDEDLIKEYAAMVDAHRSSILPSTDSAVDLSASPAVPSDLDLGTLDIDKMVVEAGSLDETAAAPAVDVLNQSIDPDKIAAEATSMTVDPQAKAVMGQFEKFATKGEKK
jgi:hypothetical protein